MIICKDNKCAYEIVDNEILTYNIVDSEIDFSSEGKLCGLASDEAKRLEKLLYIESVQDFGIEIVDEEPIIINF